MTVVDLHRPVDWSRITFYQPDDFSYPDKLDHSVVHALDRLAFVLNRCAVILDDFRFQSKNRSSQHLVGRAIDFTYPGLDSTRVLDAIHNTALFSGYGYYINAAGVASFHADTRTDRSPKTPATWGAQKGPGQTEWEYTSLRSILDFVRKAALPLGWIVAMLVGIYFLARKS